ncbi:hypothetical protein PM082_004055 [Marasmius tenuissimus]|nr:hypothetical protein PM082_004055 [Marasmius tenuissimus]
MVMNVLPILGPFIAFFSRRIPSPVSTCPPLHSHLTQSLRLKYLPRPEAYSGALHCKSSAETRAWEDVQYLGCWERWWRMSLMDAVRRPLVEEFGGDSARHPDLRHGPHSTRPSLRNTLCPSPATVLRRGHPNSSFRELKGEPPASPQVAESDGPTPHDKREVH